LCDDFGGDPAGFRVMIDDHDFRAAQSEAKRSCATDPAAAAGDERHFSGEIHAVASS
jgi:hypothetical protein